MFNGQVFPGEEVLPGGQKGAKAQEAAVSSLAVTPGRWSRGQWTHEEGLQTELKTCLTGLTTQQIPSRSQKV